MNKINLKNINLLLHKVALSGSYEDLTDAPTSLPASDVKEWAKADTKPSYTADEVNAYSKNEVDAKIAAAQLVGATDSETGAAIDLSAYATKDYVDTQVKNVDVNSLMATYQSALDNCIKKDEDINQYLSFESNNINFNLDY